MLETKGNTLKTLENKIELFLILLEEEISKISKLLFISESIR